MTRPTLVRDIEKNLYDPENSAHVKFRNENMNINQKKRYINRTWIKPMSFDSFVNMLKDASVNNFGRELQKRVGKRQDILNNSLIIIDEFHYLDIEDSDLIADRIIKAGSLFVYLP